MPSLILILGDQLNKNISSLKHANKDEDIVLMCEVVSEATYIKHHKKKIAFILSAMRHFSVELKKSGYNVIYTSLDDKNNTNSFESEVLRIAKKNHCKKVIITHPGEYRVYQNLEGLKNKKLDVTWIEDDRFLCAKAEFDNWIKARKQPRMEHFYRYMRLKHNILVSDNKPIGGKWNFDSDNRKQPKNINILTKPKQFKPDSITKTVLELVEKNFPDHFGDLHPFDLAVTRKQALAALNHFITERLVKFGDFQDAMLENEPYMYHSLLSFYLNIGLLLPQEVIVKVQKAYENNQAPINAVEGFIRQILGWREYIRGIYWYKMPKYSTNNYFKAKKSLPEFYWSGDTKLNCLSLCILETKQNAYAHHIQRLMVLGNFCLLTGIDPRHVREWYLIVYADAFEWVELPNVMGMILFADGGYLASKPYASGGAYINKMSNYCSSCHYKIKEKTGEKACPFNYLYWNFLDKHREKLSKNQRLSMVYNTLDKMDPSKLSTIRKNAKSFINSI